MEFGINYYAYGMDSVDAGNRHTFYCGDELCAYFHLSHEPSCQSYRRT